MRFRDATFVRRATTDVQRLQIGAACAAFMISSALLAAKPNTAAVNLLRNPSFEAIPAPHPGEGLMPNDWVIVAVTPDTYSNDASFGLPPNAFGNFPGVIARDGIRWVAAWGTTTAEMFGQQLSSPLQPNQTYRIGGWLHPAIRSDLANPGTYDILLAASPTTPQTAVVLGRFAPTTAPQWEQRSITFMAPPDSTSRPWLIFRPVPTGTVMSTYPGLDALSLDVVSQTDCNGNGVADSVDPMNGTSQDVNHNQFPDECEDASLLVAPRIAEGLQKLQQESQTPVVVRFNDGSHPIPRFVRVRVPIPPTLPQDPVNRALDFLVRHRTLYDLADPLSDLYPYRIVTEPDGVYVFLRQRRGDVPVDAASLVLRMNPEQSMILGTAGYYVPGLVALPSPTVTGRQAVAVAIADLAAQNARLRADPRLMYHDAGLTDGGATKTHLAWRIMVLDAGTHWRYFIDAHKGTILAADDLVKSGKDFDFYDANNTNSSICWDFSFGADDTEVWYDEEGSCCSYPNCAEACPAGCAAPNCGDLGCDADGDNLYCMVHRVYDYYTETFDWDSFDDDSEEVEAYVHIGDGACPNSWADTGEECLKFCNGTLALDIVGHEFTHLIIGETSELRYKNQSGALDESYADIFGAMIDRDEWNIADGGAGWGAGCVNLPGGGTIVGTIRNMSNPPDCNDPDHMTSPPSGDGTGLRAPCGGRCNSGNDNGGVHSNSGIPNKVASLLADGGTHNGLNVTGISREKVEQLYFSVMRHLSEGARFMDARDATVDKAREWAGDFTHGFTGANVCSVVNAFASVGLGDPDLDCDGVLDPDDPDADGDDIEDNIDHCLGLASWGNVDTDGDGLGDPCDPDKDNDGILDDGDGSGIEGDARCQGSNVNCDDNCPLMANPLQEDSNANGRGEVCDDRDGDLVLDAFDNCVSIRNSDQSDIDSDCPDPLPYLGGACGDVCDADADNDGIWDDGDFSGNRGDHPCTGGATFNCDDNCPLVANADQQDADPRNGGGTGDGVGDVCDNCDGRGRCDFMYNPSQANTDGDVCGNECDDDDDDDGVSDEDDNCQFVDNPDQFDFDFNGVGARCDSKEAIILDGFPSLDGDPVFGWIGFRMGDETLRIPIAPCAADECPEYLPENFRTIVTVTMPFADVLARISDDQGFAVARTRMGSASRSLEFLPTADFHYVLGVATSAGTQPFQGRRYFLELGRSPQMALEAAYPVSIGIRSAVIQPDDDGDGVTDNYDSCPNTVPGAPVDTNGCPPGVPGDADLDGDLDLRDFASLPLCLSGPGMPNTISNCGDSDLNTDQLVDLRDCAVIQRCFSGSNVSVRAGCGN